MFESLENRRLMHSAFSASINMQPLAAPRAPGLLTDYGGTYDVRRGGLSYGWAVDAQANSVDRNLTKVQKNDTFIAMQAGGVNNTWEIGVENGLYDVYLVGGDPAMTGDRMAITVEGEVAVSGITKPARRYIEGLVKVNVTDGKLTVGNAPWAVNNKLCYLAVVSTEEPISNTLTVDTPANLTTEGGAPGVFRISRSGDVNSAINVPLSMGGSAVNGVDYGVFGSTLRFAAGVSSIDLPVRAVNDNVAEGNETVTLTLGKVSGYNNVESTATVTIQDPAVTPPSNPAPTNISWSTKASRPVAASEILRAVVNDKLYTFGGFVDTTYHPAKSSYVYDVSANSWTRIADLPVGLTHAGITADNRYIYIAGGYPGNGSGGQQTFSSKTVYRYDTQTNAYSTLPDLPVARGAGALGYLNGKIYFVAGENSSRQDVTTVWALDLSDTGAGWVTRASTPVARNHAAAIGLNGKLYLVGGQTGNDAGSVSYGSTYRYDPSTNAWTALATMPTGRSHISDATFVYDNKIVVLGGQSAYNVAIASDVLYDPATNTWKSLNSLPDARYSGAGAYVGGKFVYTSGIKVNFSATTWVGTLS